MGNSIYTGKGKTAGWSIVGILLMAILLAGCKSVRDTARTEAQYAEKIRYDIVRMRDIDSVFVEAKTISDTVYLVKEAWRTRYRDRAVHDTVKVYAARVDTVTVIQPIETKITKWQRACMSVGKATLAGLLLALLWALCKYHARIAKILRKLP